MLFVSVKRKEHIRSKVAIIGGGDVETAKGLAQTSCTHGGMHSGG